MRNNILLADCGYEEIKDFISGIKKRIDGKYCYECKELTNHGKLNNIFRYVVYFLLPMKYIIKRNDYYYIIGWQQFFALIYAGYCKILHVKKENIVIALNYTYKRKNGIVGYIYNRFMMFCTKNKYLDYIHVPSYLYADYCEKSIGIPREKIIVAPFGLPDTYDRWKNSLVDYKNYYFSIGRSNRDYDFLIEAWGNMPRSELLIIASDNFRPKKKLPENIIHKMDISGVDQFPYIANCKAVIIPIDNGRICSGDTVLLKAMSYEKLVIVTIPSTLAEMYVKDGITGFTIPKNKDNFATVLMKYMRDKEKCMQVRKNARKKYVLEFSRYQMGERIGGFINDKINKTKDD